MSANVVGFITPCSVCGQRAIISEQIPEWTCPRCAEVAGVDALADADARIAADLNKYGFRMETALTIPTRPETPLAIAHDEPDLGHIQI